MFKKLSLPVALAAIFASSSSVAHHCPPTYIYVPIAWETVYSYKNECSYSINTYFISDGGEHIQVTGAANQDTSWSTDVNNIGCPSSVIGQIIYVNLSSPEKFIEPEFGSIPLESADLQTREENGKPTEWERVKVTPKEHPRFCPDPI